MPTLSGSFTAFKLPTSISHLSYCAIKSRNGATVCCIRLDHIIGRLRKRERPEAFIFNAFRPFLGHPWTP